MPERIGLWRRLEELSIEDRLAQHGAYQAHWYRLVAARVARLSVLDVGAADGYGLDILRVGGAGLVEGIDPLPLRDDVQRTPLSAIASRAYDVAVACDVIEHVEDDRAFLADLLRVARRGVFLSTPNYDVSMCANPFHRREYTPDELARLLAGLRLEAWTSAEDCIPASIADLTDAASNFGIWIECD